MVHFKPLDEFDEIIHIGSGSKINTQEFEQVGAERKNTWKKSRWSSAKMIIQTSFNLPLSCEAAALAPFFVLNFSNNFNNKDKIEKEN